MSKPYYSILTNIGENLVAKATALGTKLDLTTMAVGDGNGKLPAPDPAQTKLINEKRRAAVNSLEIDKNNPNIIIVEHIIPETEGGWWVREIGLFDSEGNLIAVGNCPETYKPKMIEGSGRTQIIRMMIVVKSTECIELKVDPSVVLATREYVDNIESNINYKFNELEELESSKGILISKVEGIVLDTTTDNRNAIFSSREQVYIPRGITVRCNLLPDDDVTIFNGEGKLLTRDIWGNEHIFDVALATDRTQNHSVKSRVNSILLQNKNPRVGLVGDSISEGKGSDEWKQNPIDENGNLKSINYDHDAEGGKQGYFSVFKNASRHATGLNPNRVIETCNASSSGKKLIDNWAYKNIDYGFFQNSAYKNKIPDVVLLAMGHNDVITSEELVNKYLDEFDKFIRKCWGYGSYVALISNSMCSVRNDSTEAFKDAVCKKYGIEWFDIGSALIDYAYNGRASFSDIFYEGPKDQDYDFTHPKVIGHRFMGYQLINLIFDTRITTITSDEIITGFRTAKHISYDATSREAFNTITLNDTSERFLIDFGGVSRCTAPKTPTFDFIIENKVIGGALNIVIPLPSPHNKPASVILMNANGTYQNTVSGDDSNLTGYYVMRLIDLDYGPNIIRVYYTGTSSTTGYAPFLSVSKTVKTSCCNQYYSDIRKDELLPITNVDNKSSYYNDKYDYSIGNRVADRVSDTFRGYVNFHAKYVKGMRIWIAYKPDVSYRNGYYAEILDEKTIIVKKAEDDSSVATLDNINTSDGSVRFQIKYDGNKLFMLSNAVQSVSFPRRGGLIYLENKSDSAIADYWINVASNFIN
ncbi:phage tail protein [Providencia sp. AGC89]